jgi:hypothetical protein
MTGQTIASIIRFFVAGLKRWALYPPHVKPPGLQHVQQQQLQQQTAPATPAAAAAAAVAGSDSGSSSSSWCTVSEAASSSSDWSNSWDSSSSSSSSDDHGDDSAGSGLTSLQVQPYILQCVYSNNSVRQPMVAIISQLQSDSTRVHTQLLLHANVLGSLLVDMPPVLSQSGSCMLCDISAQGM